MKKIKMAVCILALVALAGTSYAHKGRGFQGNPPCVTGPGGMGANAPANIDPEKKKAFMKATRELRITLAGQRAELKALMHQDNPDPNRARKLGEAMARTRLSIKEKALEMGLPAFRGMGPDGKRGKGMRKGQGGMRN